MGHEILQVRFAIPRELQPPGVRFPTAEVVPIDMLQKIIPVCFACHRDYPLPIDKRVIGSVLNSSFIDWDNAIKQFLNHQGRHAESAHGRIVEQVDHSLVLYNAAVIFQVLE